MCVCVCAMHWTQLVVNLNAKPFAYFRNFIRIHSSVKPSLYTKDRRKTMNYSILQTRIYKMFCFKPHLIWFEWSDEVEYWLAHNSPLSKKQQKIASEI